MAEEIVNQAQLRMAKAIEVLKQELVTIKTGKATPSLIEGVEVEAYGDRYKLIELAQINTPELHQLIVQPYDPGIIGGIKRAIELANLGLSPSINGDLLRIVVPPLTEERRQELIKAVHQRLEGARIMIRQIRQELMDKIESMFKEKTLSEDDRFRLRDQIQKVVDEKNEEVEKIGQAKETELITV